MSNYPNPKTMEKKGEEPKIGVFVCHCGHNIAATVDVKKAAEYAATLPNVVHATDYMFMCSKQGIQMVKDAIKEKGVNRTVVASCSKTQHGPTFARAIEEMGLNKHRHQQVNIREFCSWVHRDDKEKATQKAMQSILAGVNRARKLEDVETKRIQTTKKAMVIGGGIAGLRAANDLAELGIPVVLIEKESTIGGHMTQLNKTFPTFECPQCSISPLTNGIANHPLIELYTLAQVKKVTGTIGNFDVDVEIKPRYVKDNCTSCGECEAKCPVKVPSEWDSGMSQRKAIYKAYPQAIPATYVRDKSSCINCKLCIKICPVQAVDFDMKAETKQFNVGTIIVAAGYEEYDPTEIEAYHYHQEGFENIITQLQLERMLSPTSRTEGEVRRITDDTEPKNVVMIQCVGSRNELVGNEYCTGVCCKFAIKNAKILKDKYPNMNVTICYIDLRVPGLNFEEMYKSAQEIGVRFMRGRPSEIERDPLTGNLSVIVEDTLGRVPMQLKADLVVLSAAMVPPAGIGPLGSRLQVLRSKEGFLKEFHIKMNPIASSRAGVYLAGAIQGPKDISESVAQAGAAASLAAIPLVRGYIEKEMLIPEINMDLCVKCGACATACPVKAIEIDKNREPRVIEIACKSCGLCVPVCPTAAIQLKNFRDDQMYDEIKAVSGGVELCN